MLRALVAASLLLSLLSGCTAPEAPPADEVETLPEKTLTTETKETTLEVPLASNSLASPYVVPLLVTGGSPRFPVEPFTKMLNISITTDQTVEADLLVRFQAVGCSGGCFYDVKVLGGMGQREFQAPPSGDWLLVAVFTTGNEMEAVGATSGTLYVTATRTVAERTEPEGFAWVEEVFEGEGVAQAWLANPKIEEAFVIQDEAKAVRLVITVESSTESEFFGWVKPTAHSDGAVRFFTYDGTGELYLQRPGPGDYTLTLSPDGLPTMASYTLQVQQMVPEE